VRTSPELSVFVCAWALAVVAIVVVQWHAVRRSEQARRDDQ
jgi:hypothetical protein